MEPHLDNLDGENTNVMAFSSFNELFGKGGNEVIGEQTCPHRWRKAVANDLVYHCRKPIAVARIKVSEVGVLKPSPIVAMPYRNAKSSSYG